LKCCCGFARNCKLPNPFLSPDPRGALSFVRGDECYLKENLSLANTKTPFVVEMCSYPETQEMRPMEGKYAPALTYPSVHH
jgi:hypothetical protein